MDGGTPTFLSSSCKRLVCRNMFLFADQTVVVVFPDLSFVITQSPIFFFICLQMVAFELNTSSMISFSIFLNKYFLVNALVNEYI